MIQKIEIARAFSLHDFTTVYEHLTNDAVWDNVGGEKIVGKPAIVKACDDALVYFAKITTNLIDVTSYESEDSVTVMTTTTYTDDGKDSTVASCDVYGFQNDRINSIVSYNIELN